MCDNHICCIPKDRPRPLGSGAQVYVRVDDYSHCDGLFEQDGFYGTIVDRWVELFTDRSQGQDDETLPEYVYLLRRPSDNEELIVRERWLS